jgi:16S rRNA G966 N2-methylase RsmD
LGEKSHNIWRKYIENYTSENGLYLDPFAGSAMCAFEVVKANRSAIVFDLNPLTSFIVEVLSTEFNKTEFTDAVKKIIASCMISLSLPKDKLAAGGNSEKNRGTLIPQQTYRWDCVCVQKR